MIRAFKFKLMPLPLVILAQIPAHFFLNLQLSVEGKWSDTFLIFFILTSAYYFIKKLNTILKAPLRSLIFLYAMLFFYVLSAHLLRASSLSDVYPFFTNQNNGMLLYILIGVSVGSALRSSFEASNFYENTFIYFICFCATILSLHMLWKYINPNFFIIGLNDFPYQLLSVFHMIFFIIFCRTYLHYVSNLNGAKSKKFNVLFFFYSTCAGNIALAQLYGSNVATVIIIAAVLGTHFTIRVTNDFFRSYELKQIHFLKFIILKFFAIYWLYLAIALILLYFFIASVDRYFFENFRIFGFDSGFSTSLRSRVAIASAEFWRQFTFAPVFGHVDVAELVSGSDGRFIHSAFPHVLTTYGIIGFLLFSLIFIINVRAMVYVKSIKRDSQVYEYVFHLTLFSFILFIAVIGTSVHWPMIWFVFGHIFYSKISRD